MNKHCKKCNQPRDTNEFRKFSRSKDGLQSYCKTCQDSANKSLYEKNKQKRIGQVSIWNQQHPDKLKIYKDNWRKK